MADQSSYILQSLFRKVLKQIIRETTINSYYSQQRDISMHRIAATPGGWDSHTEGVVFIEQTPAPIVLITAADTDIQTLAASLPQLPVGFAALRVVNLLQLQQQLTIDTYAQDVLASAEVIILRLLGGRSYWSYGLEVVRETVQATGAALIVLPGDERQI